MDIYKYPILNKVFLEKLDQAIGWKSLVDYRTEIERNKDKLKDVSYSSVNINTVDNRDLEMPSQEAWKNYYDTMNFAINAPLEDVIKSYTPDTRYRDDIRVALSKGSVSGIAGRVAAAKEKSATQGARSNDKQANVER
jgi:hypothetical protein